MNKRLIRIYHQTWHKGRNRFAVIADGCFSLLLIFLFLYLVFRSRLHFRLLCVALSCFFTLAFLLFYKIINDRKFDKHIAKLRSEAKRRVCETKLSLMSDDVYSGFFQKDNDDLIFPIHSAEHVTVDDIRNAYIEAKDLGSKGINIIAYSPLTKAALSLIDKLDVDIKIVSPLDYKGGKTLEQLINVSESEIDLEILRTHERKKRSFRQIRSEVKLFSEIRAMRYLTIGGVLMIFSMFMRYSMYYRIIAVVAMSVGSSSYIFQEIKKSLHSEKNA